MSDKPQNIVHRSSTVNGSLGDHVITQIYNRRDTHHQLFIGPYIDVDTFLEIDEESKAKGKPRKNKRLNP